ncbi:MAG TPA: fumarylacetoacetate hydrolase family protein [candidate division Zixibacteria bacterium]|nr:fumarylacetoacetate hydrolase family protein [candidate division Zixibacteria bacterium]
MKILNFAVKDDEPRIGILWNEHELVDISKTCEKLSLDLFDEIKKIEDLYAIGDKGIEKLELFLFELNALHKKDKKAFDEIREKHFRKLEDVIILSPTYNPQKIICLGRNFAEHAKEGGKEPPKNPMIWGKFNSSINSHKKPIVLPKISEKVDVEVELVVILGKGGKHITEEKALDHVFGYTIGNDVSARDFQYEDKQFTRSKTMDTFTPLGPFVVTKEEIPDPQNLDLELTVNDKIWQSSNTKQMMFSVAYIISYLSKSFTFMPGDLIFTGTPSGVGHYQNPPVYLKQGDIVKLTISNIGTLENQVINEK